MADEIILYDRTGSPLEFHDKKVLRVDTTDGGTRDFVHANLVEKTVELDFSDGDMEIEPGADGMFSKISIPTPANLSPVNIAEGVNIAGIVGELAASGTNLKFAQGNFTGTNAKVTVQHNLGVVPDMFFLFQLSNSTKKDGKNSPCIVYGMSTAFVEATGAQYKQFRITSEPYSTSSYVTVNANRSADGNAIDASANLSGIVYGATKTEISVGGLSDYYPAEADMEYYWLAIGGLT